MEGIARRQKEVTRSDEQGSASRPVTDEGVQPRAPGERSSSRPGSCPTVDAITAHDPFDLQVHSGRIVLAV